MKKLVIFMLVIFNFTLLALSNLSAKSDNSIEDEKIAIILKQNEDMSFQIEHSTSYIFKYAVVEYAYYDDDNIFVSYLNNFPITNNRFSIKDINVVAVKVHQLLILRNGIYYRYSTSNQNTLGSFANVKRENIVEIETVAVKTVKTNYKTDNWGVTNKYWEFYFNFDKDHDSIEYIDVEYILKEIQYILWWKRIKSKQKVESRIHNDEWISSYEPNPNYNPLTPFPIFDERYPYIKSSSKIKELDKNTNSNISANYVARVSPSSASVIDLDFLKYASDSEIENFAIIRIKYEVDGEFIISDVINAPTSPIDDLTEIEEFLKEIKDFIKKIKYFINKYSQYILIFIIIFISLLLLSIFIPFLNFVFKILTFIFKIIFLPFSLFFSFKNKIKKDNDNYYVYKDINNKKYFIKK